RSPLIRRMSVDRGAVRLRRAAPNVWGFGGHGGAPMSKSRAPMSESGPPSEEKAEVLRQQHALVEHDLAPGDLEGAVLPAQQVLALADEDVGLRLHAVAIDQEAALDGQLAGRRSGRRRPEDIAVGAHVADRR